jgi:hypothetical protein
VEDTKVSSLQSKSVAIDTVADRSMFDPMWPTTPRCRDDQRNITTGLPLSTNFYADQPYLTPTHDGGLLCVVTTGLGHEGMPGQHVRAMKTFDLGHTWRNIVPVEDPEGPESSWGVPFTHPSGRVFVFYIHNTDDLREAPADDPPYPGGVTRRMDSLGHFVFRWSDDHGKSWSAERGTIPVRAFEIDRLNPTGGDVRLFWNVGLPFAVGDSLYLPLHKVGGFGEGWFTSSEGALLRSPDFLAVSDPLAAAWETLPHGDRGIRAPSGGGPIAEEHSFTTLSDGSFFTVFRTIDGHPACAYSRDKGRSWGPSQPMQFATGRPMKHPRAANFIWKMADGGYLYCFHNHGGRHLGERPDRRTHSYHGRNPLWLCRGWEADGADGNIIRWSQPEIGLYDDDPMVRISYPHFLEFKGNLILTETQKATARLHLIDPQVARALSADPGMRLADLAGMEPLASWSGQGNNGKRLMDWPTLPPFVIRDHDAPYGGLRTRESFALRFGLRLCSHTSTATLACQNGPDGSGINIEWTDKRSVRLTLSDGQTAVTAESDPVGSGVSSARFTINIDGGCGIICFFRDGALDDGGDNRQYGWNRFSPHFRNEYSFHQVELPGQKNTAVVDFHVYPRALTAAEIDHLDAR